MNDLIKKIYKYFIFILLGGSIYYSIELLYRGYSHWTMFLLGGFCYVLIGAINEIFPWDMYIEFQAAVGGLIVTMLEFIFGFILNICLGLNIWDYNDVPFNVMGQVCLPFTFIWMGLAVIAILLDDWVRYKCFSEEKPRYVSFVRNLFKSK